MKYQEHITASGNKIQIWDDLFDFPHRTAFLRKILESNFQFESSYDSEIGTQNSNWACFSKLEPAVINFMCLLPQAEPLRLALANRHPDRVWVNAATISNHFYTHSDELLDSNTKSMLYYANLEWNKNWDGYTIWRDQNSDEIEYVSDYVPGRVVIFDSVIPHKATIQNVKAPPFRFTMNSIWKTNG